MTYMYIDESGDPTFYVSGKRCIAGENGFKPILLMGMIKIDNKQNLRKAVSEFIENIKNDPLYSSARCIASNPEWYLHASYDNIEIQLKFIDFLRNLEGFKFYCVIGRKRLDVFNKKHNNNETEFYFDVIYHLLKDRLNDDGGFQIYLSKREKSTQHKLKEAIANAIERDNKIRKVPKDITYNCEIVTSKDTPELSVVDYLLWSLQRYIITKDKRFYGALEHKYNLIIDLYDFDKYKSVTGGTYYHSKNRFCLENASKFKLDGYK